MNNQVIPFLYKISDSHFLYKRITQFLISFVVLFIFLYCFFVSISTFDIVERKNIELSIRSLESEVSSLELAYLSLEQSVTIDFVKTLGFVEDENTKFVSRSIYQASAITPRGSNGF